MPSCSNARSCHTEIARLFKSLDFILIAIGSYQRALNGMTVLTFNLEATLYGGSAENASQRQEEEQRDQ